MLLKLWRQLQSPPPWLWGVEGRLWQRRGRPSLGRLPLEVLQQLHWWLIRPWSRRTPTFTPGPFPRGLRLQACWLNSYRPSELAWWWSVGERSWSQLSRHAPESVVAALHAERRLSWPDRCRPGLALLADKAALLHLTPRHWQAPFQVLLPGREATAAESGSTPDWWWSALRGPGLVLKPRHGHAGRAVIRFRSTDAGLEAQGLFRRLPAHAPLVNAPAGHGPAELMEHWQRLSSSEEPVLAMPYLTHSRALPAADPAVVVRVITRRDGPDQPIAVGEAWLEVPLGDGLVAFFSAGGLLIPSPWQRLSADQQVALQQWQELLSVGRPRCVKACLEAAQAMHALLPPIDQVAWDWIPADPEPLLLEGNGGFGLLIPQLLEHLRAPDHPA